MICGCRSVGQAARAAARSQRHGDGLISDAKTTLEQEMRAAFASGAREAGKDPGMMPVHAELFVYVGTEQEAEGAAKLWRFLPKAWTDFVNLPDPRAIDRRGAPYLRPRRQR